MTSSLYLSWHFIVVEIICANQSETKFTKNPVKFVAPGNLSINLKKLKLPELFSPG